MKYSIQYSPEARDDLDEIWEYITTELRNEDAASSTISNILDVIDALETFPERGALLSSVAEIETDYRFVLSGNYMAFYRVKGHIVFVDRILYQRREYMRTLFDDVPSEEE